MSKFAILSNGALNKAATDALRSLVGDDTVLLAGLQSEDILKVMVERIIENGGVEFKPAVTEAEEPKTEKVTLDKATPSQIKTKLLKLEATEKAVRVEVETEYRRMAIAWDGQSDGAWFQVIKVLKESKPLKRNAETKGVAKKVLIKVLEANGMTFEQAKAKGLAERAKKAESSTSNTQSDEPIL